MKFFHEASLHQRPFQSVFRNKSADKDVSIFHAHQGFELLYIHQGQGRLIVDRKIIEISARSLLLFQPFQLHRLHMDINSETPYVRSFLLAEPAALEPCLQPFPSLRSFFARICKQQLPSPVIRDQSRDHTIERLFDQLASRLNAGLQSFQIEEQYELFTCALLNHLQFNWDHSQERGGYQSPERTLKTTELARAVSHTEHIMQWIENHYREPFRLEALAAAVHLTPNHVSALFQQTVGSTISQYLQARRVRQACYLLIHTDLPIQLIGEQVGLTNVSYFCSLFKKQTGTSPLQFRQQTIGGAKK